MAADRRQDADPGRGLTAEERELWRRAMRDAEAWPGRKPPATPPPTAGPEGSPQQEPPSDQRPAGCTRTTRPRQPAAPSPAAPPLTPGRPPGLDRRSADRLRRGRLPIEARIDLHGMTQAEAQRALTGFLAASAGEGRRCVLVITGKGRPGEAAGVLRREVPRWLNLPPNRERVLGFAEARAQHGGAGALYVLLKRRREHAPGSSG